MEHPYLFFVKLFELIGLGHFAHANPHVVYSWVVMAMLIGVGFFATKSIQMIPGKRHYSFFRNQSFYMIYGFRSHYQFIFRIQDKMEIIPMLLYKRFHMDWQFK